MIQSVINLGSYGNPLQSVPFRAESLVVLAQIWFLERDLFTLVGVNIYSRFTMNNSTVMQHWQNDWDCKGLKINHCWIFLGNPQLIAVIHLFLLRLPLLLSDSCLKAIQKNIVYSSLSRNTFQWHVEIYNMRCNVLRHCSGSDNRTSFYLII